MAFFMWLIFFIFHLQKEKEKNNIRVSKEKIKNDENKQKERGLNRDYY
jgi:hypothetical protein